MWARACSFTSPSFKWSPRNTSTSAANLKIYTMIPSVKHIKSGRNNCQLVAMWQHHNKQCPPGPPTHKNPQWNRPHLVFGGTFNFMRYTQRTTSYTSHGWTARRGRRRSMIYRSAHGRNARSDSLLTALRVTRLRLWHPPPPPFFLLFNLSSQLDEVSHRRKK